MTAVVYAHKAGRGNGVGLHYSRFRPSWRFIIPPNQRLGLMLPAQNRHFPPRIREVGLNRVQFETRSTNLPRSPRGGEDLNWNLRVSNWTRFSLADPPQDDKAVRSQRFATCEGNASFDNAELPPAWKELAATEGRRVQL